MTTTSDNLKGNYIFGLDIGTRSIVGIVGYKDNALFKVVASSIVEHDTRSMIDGQIHDIQSVAQTIKKVKTNLENKLGFSLHKVCIAAAGRVLKTTTVHVEQDIEANRTIDEDAIYSLELLGMERAHQDVNETLLQVELGYHCVGYTVTKYYLNEYEINNLLGHQGKKIGADVLATFLPNEVVNSLYKVVEIAGLEVYSLTLEPIAAISIAIPENYRLLNIALVDIGAGTSDIAITKDGSIIAYGMIPVAGDEITEEIVHKLLVDFKTAEKIKIASSSKKKTIPYKDIMGIGHKITNEEINEIIKDKVEQLAVKIAEKICELNGDVATNAVFVVGGGGQVKAFTQGLAEYMKIDIARVAIRGKEILKNVETDNVLKKTPEIVTPIGICVTGLNENKHDFVQVFFNDEPINIYNTNHLTVMDVAAFKGYNPKKLLPTRGKDLTFVINDMEKSIKAEYGEPAKIMINNQEANLNSNVVMNDYIAIIPAKNGRHAKMTTNELLESLTGIHFTIEGQRMDMKPYLLVNDKVVNHHYSIKDHDHITTVNPTINQVISKFNLEYSNEQIVKNDILAQLSDEVIDGDIIRLHKKQEKSTNDMSVIVNEKRVIMTGKESYIIADLFDYIDFDRSKPRGEVVCLINEKQVHFMDKINRDDIIQIYWSMDKGE